MTSSAISSLAVGARGITIELRVLRVWHPRFKETENCYIFADKHGHIIQAFIHSNDQNVVASKLTLMGCYQITDYACTAPVPHANVLPHPINLRIGAATSIVPIHDSNEIPLEHYNITSFEDLQGLCDQPDSYTDFIGTTERIEDKTTRDQSRPYVNLTLSDINDNIITLTLWEEICTCIARFDRHRFHELIYPAIIGATSLKVTSFSGGPIKLQSTVATYTYPQPAHPMATSLLNRQRPQTQRPGAASATVSTGERIVLASLLSKTYQDLIGKTFVCRGGIVDFIPTNAWYYAACPICSTTVFESDNSWFCPSHGYKNTPKLMYRIVTTIADETSKTNVTMFNETVQALLKKPCSELVITEGYENKVVLPPTLLTLKGISKDFAIHVQREGRTATPRFFVKAATDPIVGESSPPIHEQVALSTTHEPDRLRPRQLRFDATASDQPPDEALTKRTRYPD